MAFRRRLLCAEVERLFSETEAAMGPVDILVNNAGITRDGLIMRMKDPDWEDVIRTTFCRYFLPPGRPSGIWRAPAGPNSQYQFGDSIIGNAGQANYAAAKQG
jgi:3-oxoacyl-[acyl-carrier protein] reductase